MNKITLIEAEWNRHNGFIFGILDLELYNPINIDSALLGFNFSKNFLYIDILWIKINVFDKTETN